MITITIIMFIILVYFIMYCICPAIVLFWLSMPIIVIISMIVYGEIQDWLYVRDHPEIKEWRRKRKEAEDAEEAIILQKLRERRERKKQRERRERRELRERRRERRNRE